MVHLWVSKNKMDANCSPHSLGKMINFIGDPYGFMTVDDNE